MTIQRMDTVGIVVEDLAAAIAFFSELGMELEGTAEIEGSWADRTVGLDGVRSEIAMLRTPDGHGRLELASYRAPAVVRSQPRCPPPNTLGLHRAMFVVDDIDDTLARLRQHGAELLGGVARYADRYRLCYLRGPAGIILALAESLDQSALVFPASAAPHLAADVSGLLRAGNQGTWRSPPTEPEAVVRAADWYCTSGRLRASVRGAWAAPASCRRSQRSPRAKCRREPYRNRSPGG